MSVLLNYLLPHRPASTTTFPFPHLKTTHRFSHHSNKNSFSVKAVNSNHYTTLNVPRNATLPEIRAAYHNLARKYHPDMNKSAGAEEMFKEISAAYEVLSDEEKRLVYDRFGETGLQRQHYGGTATYSQRTDPFDFINTIFNGAEVFFGTSGEASFSFGNKTKRGLNIRHDLDLSFEESIFGGPRQIQISCVDTCDNCSGTGARSSRSIKTCPQCGGRGGMIKNHRTRYRNITKIYPCSSCLGDGKIISDHCQRCRGSRKVQSKRNITVVIPPGVTDGSTMRIRGEGNIDMNRGVAGDVYLVLHVNEKDGIWREGLHLYSKIEIDYTDAILGNVVKVETVEGLKDLQIPSGIQPGDAVKLKQMGVPNTNKPSVRGDHYFIVNIVIPKKISKKERAFVEEIASLKASDGHRGKFVKSKGKEKNGVNSILEDVKHVASLWNTFEKFMRREQSQERFASISVEIPTLPRTSGRAEFSPILSSSLAFIIACVFFLVRKTYVDTIARKTRLPLLPRTSKEHINRDEQND